MASQGFAKYIGIGSFDRRIALQLQVPTTKNLARNVDMGWRVFLREQVGANSDMFYSTILGPSGTHLQPQSSVQSAPYIVASSCVVMYNRQSAVDAFLHHV